MTYPVRVPDWIRYHARGLPDRTAIVDLGSGRSLTYAQMHDRIDRLAAALAEDFGIGSGLPRFDTPEAAPPGSLGAGSGLVRARGARQ